MRSRVAVALVAAIILTLGAACTSPASPTAVQPTWTSRPTARATATRAPSRTRQPTRTPEPTATKPSDTPARPGGLQQALVTRVVDGDTIVVRIDGEAFKLRYIGIDTPETVHPDKPVESMGPEASEANRRLVEGRTVYLEKDVSETDRYGRLLRYVWVGDTMVNAELVRLGYAQASSYPPDVKHQELFAQLQREAREAGRGLWAEEAPSPTEAPSSSAAGGGSVALGTLHYDGDVPQVESDEWIEVVNQGSEPVELDGWVLRDDDRNAFQFPSYTLEPGASCRVYTDEVHRETGGFTFGSPDAIWGTSRDLVALVDPSGQVVDSACWGRGCP